MPILMVEVADSNLLNAVEALKPFVPAGSLKLLHAGKLDLPGPPSPGLVAKVVAAIRPRATQPMRKEALRALFGGHDTFSDQRGEEDPALRNAVGAISKSLRDVFPAGDGLDRLVTRKRMRFPDGGYRGTSYVVTPLGQEVAKRLRKEGTI